MSDTEVPSAKSEAQAMLDRMLKQCNRLHALRLRLDDVRGSIAPAPSKPAGGASGGEAAGAGARKGSFFDGVKVLLDANDRIADQIEQSVDELKALF